MYHRLAVRLIVAVAVVGLSGGLAGANQGSPFDLTPGTTPPNPSANEPAAPAPLPEATKPASTGAPSTTTPGAAPKAVRKFIVLFAVSPRRRNLLRANPGA